MTAKPEPERLIVKELPPDSHQITLTHTQSRLVGTYMPVFARSSAKGEWGFNVSHPAENGKFVELKKFWECPLLSDYLRDGKIYEDRKDLDGVDIYMKKSDLVEYLQSLIEQIKPTSDLEREQFAEFRVFIAKYRESPPKVDSFVRLRNSYSISDVARMYDPSLIENDKYFYYAVGQNTNKAMRVRSEDSLHDCQSCDAIARARVLEANGETVARALVEEAQSEGFPFNDDALAQIAGVWQEFQNSEVGMKVVIAGDVGKRDESSTAAFPIYKAFASDINEEQRRFGELIDAYVYFTDSQAATRDGAMFIAIMDKYFEPHAFSVKIVESIQGTDDKQYQMIIIVPNE